MLLQTCKGSEAWSRVGKAYRLCLGKAGVQDECVAHCSFKPFALGTAGTEWHNKTHFCFTETVFKSLKSNVIEFWGYFCHCNVFLCYSTGRMNRKQTRQQQLLECCDQTGSPTTRRLKSHLSFIVCS